MRDSDARLAGPDVDVETPPRWTPAVVAGVIAALVVILSVSFVGCVVVVVTKIDTGHDCPPEDVFPVPADAVQIYTRTSGGSGGCFGRTSVFAGQRPATVLVDEMVVGMKAAGWTIKGRGNAYDARREDVLLTLQRFADALEEEKRDRPAARFATTILPLLPAQYRDETRLLIFLTAST